MMSKLPKLVNKKTNAGLRGMGGEGALNSLALDFTTLPDGTIPTLSGSKWTVANGKAKCSPDLGANVIQNGGFATDTIWIKGAGWTIAGDGSPAVKVNNGLARKLEQNCLTMNRFYKATADIVRTTGDFYLMFGATEYGVAITANGAYSETGWAIDTYAAVWGGSADSAGTVDNVVYNPLTTSQLLAGAKFSHNYGTVGASWNRVRQPLCGVFMCLDSLENPQNGVFAMIGRTIRLIKMVNGVFTPLNTGSGILYSDGAPIEIRRANGTDVFQLFYNNVQGGIDYTVPGMTGTYHGLFSTDPVNTCTSFFLRSVNTTPINLLMLGDSKTAAFGGIPARFFDGVHAFSETPTRIATGGWTTAVLKQGIDAGLLAAVGTPNYVLINIGANDIGAMPVEADWKSNMNYILAALHTKYPGVPCYIMRVWRRGFASDCDTFNSWIGDIVTADALAYLGPDERVFLEGGDDGVTWTADGVHPTSDGYTLTARQWTSVMGL
jgi:lysophospholipase L1-like esterase